MSWAFCSTVLEEDAEIGTPEHCGGLVSISGVENLGIIPSNNAIENNEIKYAKIFSPSKCFELNAGKQKIVVLDRRTFDKQVAFQAQKMGAEIRVKCSMYSISKKHNTTNNNYNNRDNGYYLIKTSEGLLTCNYFVDARGIGSLIQHSRLGLLQVLHMKYMLHGLIAILLK